MFSSFYVALTRTRATALLLVAAPGFRRRVRAPCAHSRARCSQEPLSTDLPGREYRLKENREYRPSASHQELDLCRFVVLIL